MTAADTTPFRIEAFEKSLQKKLIFLEINLKSIRRVVVALSGGVDSSTIAALASEILGEKNVITAIAVSPSLSPTNRKMALKVSKLIGVQTLEIKTNETENPDYQKNDPLRCYYCKHVVYSELKKIALEKNAVLVDGFNTDDTAETRPGMRAAKEQAVHHPLFEAGITKKEVRTIAKKLGLPNWNKSADACLSSRFQTGIPVNAIQLQQIAKAESKLQKILKLKNEQTLRLRHLGNQTARVELDDFLLPLTTAMKKGIIDEVKRFGYRSVSITPYKRGSASATSK